jgi:uncharacterized membrane protein YeaQ/YmgE (transglycosylase-associated protein family)
MRVAAVLRLEIGQQPITQRITRWQPGTGHRGKEVSKMHPIIFWIIVGIIAGALAKVVVPGEGPGGILGDLIIGILGAIIGGFVASALGIVAGGWVGSTVVALIGAIILLAILRAVGTRRTTV